VSPRKSYLIAPLLLLLLLTIVSLNAPPAQAQQLPAPTNLRANVRWPRVASPAARSEYAPMRGVQPP